MATMKESCAVENRIIKSHDNEDRISALPDSIIQHILSFLPSTREAVRTGILCKSWRNQWTHVPVLIFKPPYYNSGEEYFRFIENTLILHDCPKIKKFHLEYDAHWRPDPQFTSKIRFATRKCVEELVLICEREDGDSYLLPEFLFDNSSLVALEMVNCYYTPGRRVNWPSLKSLTMDFINFSDLADTDEVIGNAVFGCPLLERLTLCRVMLDQVVIVSHSLKVLSFIDCEAGIPDAAVEISCPNLVALHVITGSFPAQVIENVLSSSPYIHSLDLAYCDGFNKLVIASTSLKELFLDAFDNENFEVSCPNLELLHYTCRGGNLFQAVNLPSSACVTLDYVWPLDCQNLLVKPLLEQFQHVNELTIEREFFEILSNLDVEAFLSLPVLNSKCLTLNVGADHIGLALSGIAYALRSPTIETLVVKLNPGFHQDTLQNNPGDLENSRFHNWSSDGSTGLICLESPLKTVKIIGQHKKDVKCERVLRVIEFLLKNARVS